ncbi:MAG: hypothetical protein COV59_03030 [Candidatus Magasanikbacteria bacterium CG11_big_fil_rev_8_21_14_0_20_39_34]|uniref:Rod shape-determining protein MreD n=1 Tax=Candidatus Magasanikbacteria bacterium CG11_big_fil_rev_8_21_14_0_20_39_34 TaxID=1974653 RepID=A0A2H0N5G9_9BACT|nr:MAG: hypothetical protein COV59_03030 [Candidatus Magasanikbacteria bacterium CG11_big_fil_rev_8_21_14_0_20_39_34]
MNSLLKTIGWICILFLVIFLHFTCLYLLPYPFDHLNILFFFFVNSIFWGGSGRIVWVAFVLFFILDLYTGTPFGLLLVIGPISVLFSYWLFMYLFTNRSIFALLGLLVLSLAIYRGLYLGVLFIFSFFHQIAISAILISVTFAWEALFTGAAILISYPFLHKIFRNKKIAFS